MKSLIDLFYENPYHHTTKFIHYLFIYDQLFSKYRDKEVSILEIGVASGGSLELWKTYFGTKAKIYGIDISDRVPDFKNDNQIKVFEGSQNDRQFLKKIKTEIPNIDILIDDGSHLSQDQIITFEEMFLHINDEGIYIVEDLHNAWHPSNTGTLFPFYINALCNRMHTNLFSTEEFLERIVNK